MPLDNFWDYFILVFTFYYYDDEDELIEKRKEKLKDFESTFNIFFSAFNKTKNIKKIDFSKIKIEFVNLKVKKDKKDKYKNLISIFKEKSKLEPFFHKIEIDFKSEKLMLLNKENNNIGDLYNVQYKIYNYINKKGEIIKTISKPIKKEFIKQILKKEFDENFQDNCRKVSGDSMIIGFFGWIAGSILSCYCPPVMIGTFIFFGACNAVALGGIVAGILGKESCENLINKEFNEQKIIDEILLEDDE